MSSLPQHLSSSNRAQNEETPLLMKSSNPVPIWDAFKKHVTVDVSREWADVVLLFCYIITGLLDSSAVFIWGSFVSMQTGNTVYLGLGLVDPYSSNRWIKSGTSIFFFCLGSFFFSRFHRFFSPQRRWVLIASYSIQLLFILIAALIVTFSRNKSSGWQVLVPIASVAFQSSGQAVTSRALKFPGLTSVVLTSNYCDLFSDPGLFNLRNVERNRRTAAPILLLLGAVCGGLWAHSEVGLAGALWTAVIMKALVVATWSVWPAEGSGEDE
ncbi:hypothetical protein GQ43DRAFT_457470 [Delitschia confertaspora ATCC 74209]|uniref:DUF1275 domain protein n=1 Tax=Delitschia confertaspora ATCC 74209 TaxID=1513339 RepID=A0A9P4JGI0_9PLEO|nr:hypothetical protein GQ43DRAFT_457470 [Delitschia confertaspora ATCC 74209]